MLPRVKCVRGESLLFLSNHLFRTRQLVGQLFQVDILEIPMSVNGNKYLLVREDAFLSGYNVYQ